MRSHIGRNRSRGYSTNLWLLDRTPRGESLTTEGASLATPKSKPAHAELSSPRLSVRDYRRSRQKESWARYLGQSSVASGRRKRRALRSLGTVFLHISDSLLRDRRTFLPALFLIGSFWAERGFSAELHRIGIVSAFDPELKAVEQAIIPQNAESKIKQVN